MNKLHNIDRILNNAIYNGLKSNNYIKDYLDDNEYFMLKILINNIDKHPYGSGINPETSINGTKRATYNNIKILLLRKLNRYII
jgi:hypothetical protein